MVAKCTAMFTITLLGVQNGSHVDTDEIRCRYGIGRVDTHVFVLAYDFPITGKKLRVRGGSDRSSAYFDLDRYSQTILKNILLSVSLSTINLEVTQLLIGQTVWFSQSGVVLLSNASK